MKQPPPYIHSPSVHHPRSAEEVVPLIIEMLSPKSVVDIGCGLGSWLSVFTQHNVPQIQGVDGHWVNKSLLRIPLEHFLEANLTQTLLLDKKYDLALCLEVAEHLPTSAATTLVNSLANASDTIVFSAAIPYQGGQNHLNEQAPQYWMQLFESHGYHCYDPIRPLIWDNPHVEFWYKQNILIFSKNKQSFPLMGKMAHLVHPQLLADKEHIYQNLISGRSGLRWGFRVLMRSIIFFVKKGLKIFN